MEKPLRLLTFLLIFTWGFLLQGTYQEAYGQGLRKKGSERELKFPADMETQNLDFNLESEGHKKFTINLNKTSRVPVKVKVYDILGNLILEDQIKPADGKQKKYDFSGINSQLFVVEVGNAKYNKTKSIYASPPGKRPKSNLVEK